MNDRYFLLLADYATRDRISGLLAVVAICAVIGWTVLATAPLFKRYRSWLPQVYNGYLLSVYYGLFVAYLFLI